MLETEYNSWAQYQKTRLKIQLVGTELFLTCTVYHRFLCMGRLVCDSHLIHLIHSLDYSTIHRVIPTQ
jgi:hypothetical protein